MIPSTMETQAQELARIYREQGVRFAHHKFTEYCKPLMGFEIRALRTRFQELVQAKQETK